MAVTQMTAKQESEALKDGKDIIEAHAKKFRDQGKAKGIDHEDLVQVGSIGYLRAVRMYDPDKGASLRTYAGLRALAAIRAEIGETNDGLLTPAPVQPSLDAPIVLGPDGGTGTLHDLMTDPLAESPEDIAMRNERIGMVRRAASVLDPRGAEVLFSSETNEAIGQRMGLTRSRIQQIRTDALDVVSRRARLAS